MWAYLDVSFSRWPLPLSAGVGTSAVSRPDRNDVQLSPAPALYARSSLHVLRAWHGSTELAVIQSAEF